MFTPGAGSHHRTTAPLPLSQSTSAVHLHSDQDAPPPVAVTRRLTKRRKPFEGIFGSSSSAPATDTTSTTSSQTVTSELLKRQSIFKSASTSSIAQTISNASIVPSEKTQKHSSMLGCFTRRLSIMRCVTSGHSRGVTMGPADNRCKYRPHLSHDTSTIFGNSGVSIRESPRHARAATSGCDDPFSGFDATWNTRG
jgi:hypothetical protein